MNQVPVEYELRLAVCEKDKIAAQRLRYIVFVEELGGDGPLVDHDARLEKDEYDDFAAHLVLIDKSNGDPHNVVGVYRLMDSDMAQRAGQFYSAGEYDLAPLLANNRPALELGRSCLHPDHRGGAAMYHLWHGLSEYVAKHGIEILFGTASFHGTDISSLAQPLSLLHHRHLAPESLRVTVLPEHGVQMDVLPDDQISRKEAMLQIPALIKAYLRIGGYVGQGAFVDHAFNTTDVMLILDTAQMNDKQHALYTGRRKGQKT